MMGYNQYPSQLPLISEGAALFCEGKESLCNAQVSGGALRSKKNGSVKLPVGIKNSWKYEKDLYKYLKE